MRSIFLVCLALLLSSAVASEWLNKEQDVASLSKLINSLEDTLPTDTLAEIEEEDDLALGASVSVSSSVNVPQQPGAPTPLPVQTGPTLWFSSMWATIAETDSQGHMITLMQSVATATDTVVPITCSATQLVGTRFAACPQSLTIPAGQTTVSFRIVPVDNNIIDGTALVTVAAVADSLIQGSGVQWKNTENRFTSFEITDDDATKPAPAPPRLARCDPRLPTEITISGAGDTLANQDYKLNGARGVYYCTYIGEERSNWAIGIRGAAVTGRRLMQANIGSAQRWQIWWNALNRAGGGQIRYESLNLDPMLGFLGPFQPFAGFRPTPRVMAKTLSKAITEACVQVTGPTGVDAKFAQFYVWEDTLIFGLTRYRGVTDNKLVIVFQVENIFNQNTGYWYITEDTSFTPWYRSTDRNTAVTSTYITQAKATGTTVPTVTISSAANCPSTASGTCVSATGSTNSQVNQKYKKNENATGRLSIYIGEQFTAWSIASYSQGSENWSGYWFIGQNGNQIYYANRRGLPITSQYYAVTSNALNQGTVTVVSSSC